MQLKTVMPFLIFCAVMNRINTRWAVRILLCLPLQRIVVNNSRRETVSLIKRIAILSVHTSPLAALGGRKTGGMNVYVREFAEELGRRGVAVDIYTRRTACDTPEVDASLGEGVQVINIKAGNCQPLDPDQVYPHLSQFAAGVIAFTTKHNLQYDMIYSHYWLSGWVAHKLKEVWNTPFVHMFHTLGHMKNRIDAGHAPVPDVRVSIETQIVQWADRIVAATPAEQAQLLWLYRADRRKIVIAPPGVNTHWFRPLPQDAAKHQLGVSGVCHLLLFVGRIEPLKAVDTILEAISLIRRDHGHLLERVCFAVIGGDPDNPADRELANLRELVAALKLDDIVEFLGAKDQKLLPLYYAAASAVIVPSDYESFGMVALEAMATGTPVIASEVGGLAFLVRTEETGFLVPVRDPSALAEGIMTILTQPDKRKLLGKNAARLAQQYTWSNIVDQLMPTFDEVVSQRTGAALSHRRR
jgi:D-inositol-3-phosphate glycosyltransferase